MKHYARSRGWCEWDDFGDWQRRALRDLDDPAAAALSPFQLLSLPGISAAQQRRCATQWMTARLAASAGDRALLASITALDDLRAASAIHADGIDILVDLKGYTAGTRTAMLTYRPAPVQVSFLGYPGTLGGGFCDYLVSDRFITPADRAADHSEALACLPHSYQPHGRHAEIGAAPTRESAGLPREGLVLCGFNQAWKFTPEVFGIWCDLLARTPGSVLWLLHNEQAEGNLRGKLAAQRLVAPLFDVAGYTQGLEDLYAEMWQRQRAGLAPRRMGR
ncbi:MAG: hypothetical protein ABI702_14175 [Burkholderiales bacterium]